jgi:hypothetical protein
VLVRVVRGKKLKIDFRVHPLWRTNPGYAKVLREAPVRLIVPAFLFLAVLSGIAQKNAYSQIDFPAGREAAGRGDPAVAERYAQWAKSIADQGLWREALAALERASDFAAASSDISYLLAFARFHEKKPLGSVLEALEMSLAVNRWNLYGPEAARLLKAECLITVRAYQEALRELSLVSKSPEEAVLTLRALLPSQPVEFRRYMTDTLDRYPRESGPVRIFFGFLSNEHAAGMNPGRDALELLELVIRRLPVLILRDAELAWMAAPFMRDSAEARRMLMAYRAVNKPVLASLPATLRLGILDEESAIEELFAGGGAETALDMALLAEVWELLRSEEARALFRRNLSVYTGVITEDADRDGIPESFAEYNRGMLISYTYDADQDVLPDLTVSFEAGDPSQALVFLPPEPQGSRKVASIQWERYPAVLEAELEGVRYIPRPLSFFFSPFTFTELWGSGLLFPQRDHLSPPLTRRVLVSNSLRVERPSLEFSGGMEVVELNQGIPVRAREYVGDLMVSETEFLRGRPQLQRLDLDLDGRIDTVRRFSRSYRAAELEELWDYDRDFDYTESVQDGTFENW